MDRENKRLTAMDKTDVIGIVRQYADLVNSAFEPEKIFLFGSYAKGNYTEDSDIDVAVVLKDYGSVIDMQLELMKLRRKIDSRIEPHPFRKCDFEQSNPLASEILKHGLEFPITINS